MLSEAFRTANVLWNGLSPIERGTVLYDCGLIDESPEQFEITNPKIERFYTAFEEMTPEESARFQTKVTKHWLFESKILEDSDAFLRNSDEGFSDRIIIALGLYPGAVRSRRITAKLGETGAVPKNPRNLLQQLANAKAVEALQDDDGETRFRLTKSGLSRRNQLLGLS